MSQDGLLARLVKLQPVVTSSIGASAGGRSAGIEESVLVGGVLSGLFSLLQFMSSFVIGTLSDSHGRRPVLLLCMGGTCLSYLLWFLADDFNLFVLSRALGGMSKGIVQISTSIVADVTDPQSRTKGMALVGIAFSLGFTLGPPLGAFFATHDATDFLPISVASLAPHRFSVPALFSLLLSLIDFFFLALALPETKPATTERYCSATWCIQIQNNTLTCQQQRGSLRDWEHPAVSKS